MRKKIKSVIFLGVIVLIILIILTINLTQSNNGTDNKIVLCIAENSKMYITPTCGVCAAQKQILGENLDKFEIINCATNREECIEKQITYVPTWIINGEKVVGKQTLEQLKILTNCQDG